VVEARVGQMSESLGTHPPPYHRETAVSLGPAAGATVQTPLPRAGAREGCADFGAGDYLMA